MCHPIRRGLGAVVLAALLPCSSLYLPPLHAAPAGQEALDRAAYARLPVCKLRPDGRALAVEPCRTAPTRRPVPRRPVPQEITPTPRMAAPAVTQAETQAETAAEAPAPLFQLAPRPGPVGTVPSTPPPGTYAPGAFGTPPPNAPRSFNCGAAGCRDATGTPYNGSKVLTSPTGRLCHSSAGFVTCM